VERSTGRLRSAARGLAITAISLATLGVAASCVIACIPAWPWALLAHFRVQAVAAGLLVVGGAAALRLRGYFDAAVIATLLHVLVIAPDLGASPGSGPRDGIAIRALLLNVHTESSGFDRVRRLIADEHPDLIGLVEVDQRWLDALAPALAGYARLEQPRTDNFGVALYARGQITGAIEDLGSRQPTVLACVAIDEARFAVILTHPLPPMSAAALAEQGDQLDAVADRARAVRGPVLVMGDLNATPWSRPFRRLIDRSGLCDSRAGFGLQASFPATSVVLRIPIDHLLASCAVGVRDRRIGRDVGSDHLPVLVDLVIPR
jgi:endonuclease/exonuclease/phosphatase (EEP) superfamily protein YafD